MATTTSTPTSTAGLSPTGQSQVDSVAAAMAESQAFQVAMQLLTQEDTVKKAASQAIMGAFTRIQGR